MERVLPSRIVSLLPSATEIVCAVGMEAGLVGVSHECDWPPTVVGRPVLTRPKIAPDRPSAEIDRDVRALVRTALAVYDLDEEGLTRARPDVIVTQDLCDVCAVSYDDVLAAARRLTHPAVRIVRLHPERLGDVWADIGRVGAALAREREAERCLAAMDARVAAVTARTVGGPRPAVLVLEWLDPPMVAGTWIPELVELVGGRPLVTRPGDRAPTLSRPELGALSPAPDVVVVAPCGFPLERTQRELATLGALLEDLDWPAVRAGAVWLADGNAFFNRPGPRIVDSLEILAACVHPTLCPDLMARHAGSLARLARAAA
jgi:iron complex transport system substrate-binding protein